MCKVKKVALKGLGLLVLFALPIYAATNEAQPYSKLLHRYVVGGLVDYQAIQKSPDFLAKTMNQFQAISEKDYKKWTENEQKAFWINAYNAVVIKTIVDHYPLKKGLSWKALRYPSNSIQQIPDVWDKKAIHLLGAARSLNDIEHKILRKEFKDPRIHFALVCASIGCPTLCSEPYSDTKLDSQLKDQIRTFLSNRQKAYYDQQSDTLYLSPIFKWFGKDFKSSGGVIAFAKKYWPAEGVNSLSAETKIKWLDYDWSLNEKRVSHEK